MGGWSAFGPERKITKSKGNVLYELDGQSALSLYKSYLGAHAEKLPASGLLFPLSVKESNDSDHYLVRTLLSIDENEQSMTFAGDIQEGHVSRFMKCNDNDLINGAENAAKICLEKSASTELAIMVSCVGRKLVLKQETEEELDAVKKILGDKTVLAGFYSYGEICPSLNHHSSELHNQTMTITTFSEKK
jgi:hypothetical protein